MPITIIDDTSPDILYSGQWTLGGADEMYSRAAHGSLKENSQAVVSFSGRSIEVYGTIGKARDSEDSAYAPLGITYAVDENKASTSTFTGQLGIENQLLYRSPDLVDGQHQLVVTLTASNKNMLWIDYLKVDSATHWAGTRRAAPSRPVKPALIAGAVAGGVVGLFLLVTIVIFLRRRSQSRKVQYEKVAWKPIQAYWPWSRPPNELTAFNDDPYGETQPLGSLRPFSLQSSHHPPQSRPTSQSSDPRSLTSLTGSTVRDSMTTGKASSHSSRDSRGTGTSSMSGYTVQGSTWADKVQVPSVPSLTFGAPGASSSSSQLSHTSGHTHTSASGYTVQGGTWADKVTSTEIMQPPADTARDERSGYTSQSGYTVRGGTHRDKTERRSQASSGSGSGSGSSLRSSLGVSAPRTVGSNRGVRPESSNALDLAPRPFISAYTTNRRALEGEEALPAYTNLRHSVLR
ncbi:hypothetical protein H0H92_002173 [Tricholoma furcatifolium]|nr:hypothetical protein H0H92_002173 [Tricholoma furcatifolium]